MRAAPCCTSVARATFGRGSARTSRAGVSGRRSRQRSAALERVDWHEAGSELEAALEELRLLREHRPPANARNTRPDRHLYLRRRGERWSATEEPTALGPLRSRRTAQASRARPRRPRGRRSPRSPPGASRKAGQAFAGRSDSRTLRGSATGSRRSVEAVARTRRAGAAPRAPRVRRGAGARGRVSPRVRHRGRAHRSLARAPVRQRTRVTRLRRWLPTRTPDSAEVTAVEVDELMLVATFLRRPPPELRVVALEPSAVAAVCASSLCRVSVAAGCDVRRSRRRGGRAQAHPARRRARPACSTCSRSSFAARRPRAAQRQPPAVERFCKGIIDAVAPYVVAVKPQVAFFEALGVAGWTALEAVSRYAREAGLLVIADAKRGDIGSTARAYASAFLEPTAGAARSPTR